jgi:hypothetical protein
VGLGGFNASASVSHDLVEEDIINSYLGSSKVSVSDLPKSMSTSSSGGSRRHASTIAQEISDMERESNFLAIREEARELKTILDVTRYARSYLPGQLVNTEESIKFISEQLCLPLIPNENFLEIWGDATLTYVERRKIMEKIHLLEED